MGAAFSAKHLRSDKTSTSPLENVLITLNLSERLSLELLVYRISLFDKMEPFMSTTVLWGLDNTSGPPKVSCISCSACVRTCIAKQNMANLCIAYMIKRQEASIEDARTGAILRERREFG